MSTRGSIGFRHNGQDYLTYNHSDSYPEGLGLEALKLTKELIQNPGLKWVRKMLDDVKAVTKDTSPQPEDIEALKAYTNIHCGEQSVEDWYCLTRGLQGNLKEMLKCGYMFVNNDFIYDSCFCEYAYIINLDDEILEVYHGCNHGRCGKESRYKFNPDKIQGYRTDSPIEEQFFPCSIAAKFPFNNLPKDDRTFLKTITPMSEEEAEWLKEKFDTYFKQLCAKQMLTEIESKIGPENMKHLVNELMNAFKAGYELEKYD